MDTRIVIGFVRQIRTGFNKEVVHVLNVLGIVASAADAPLAEYDLSLFATRAVKPGL
jgi:hypothetical protein